MYCKRCGAQIDDDSKFCPSCGQGTLQTDATKGFILACWNGEKSLVFTFWVILFGINVIMSAIYESPSHSRWAASLGPLSSLFYATVLAAVIVFQCVSTWRSAGHYTGWAGWKIMARVFVLVNIVATTLTFMAVFFAAFFDAYFGR